MKIWNHLILTIFSILNALSNIICGMVCDWLSKKQLLSHSIFLAIIHFTFSSIFIIIAIFQFIPIQHNLFIIVALLLSFVGKNI